MSDLLFKVLYWHGWSLSHWCLGDRVGCAKVDPNHLSFPSSQFLASSLHQENVFTVNNIFFITEFQQSRQDVLLRMVSSNVDLFAQGLPELLDLAWGLAEESLLHLPVVFTMSSDCLDKRIVLSLVPHNFGVAACVRRLD